MSPYASLSVFSVLFLLFISLSYSFLTLSCVNCAISTSGYTLIVILLPEYALSSANTSPSGMSGSFISSRLPLSRTKIVVSVFITPSGSPSIR